MDSFNISKEAWIFPPDFFKSFFQDHNTTYEHKVCGYPDKLPKKITNNFTCNPGCERIFSKHFNKSQIPYNKMDSTFNFARFLHQSLEVSTYVHYAYPNISTTPITVMGCRQCLPLSLVQLKGKHCRKLHCRYGVVECRYIRALSNIHGPLL